MCPVTKCLASSPVLENRRLLFFACRPIAIIDRIGRVLASQRGNWNLLRLNGSYLELTRRRNVCSLFLCRVCSPNVDTTTPAAASEPKTVKVDRTQPSELAKGSKDMPGTKDRVACDFRCPLEDEVTPSVCPDAAAPVCDKGQAYQDRGHCDRENYR